MTQVASGRVCSVGCSRSRIFTTCESTEQCICIKFCFKIGKPQRKYINYCSKHTVKMQWVVNKCLTGSVDLKRVEAKQRSSYWLFWFWGYRKPRVALDGQTINKEFYLQVLRRLRESVRRKRPEEWRDGDWILHHDKAPANTSHIVQQFLARHGTAQLQQPPYSPDLAPCDFFLFRRL